MKFTLFALVALLIGANAVKINIDMYSKPLGEDPEFTPVSYTNGADKSSCSISDQSSYLQFYFNLRVPELPAVVEDASIELTNIPEKTPSGTPFAKAAVVRAVPENFVPDPEKIRQPLFDPTGPNSPIFMTPLVNAASFTSNTLKFDFQSSGDKKGIIFDTHTFLYVIIEQCGYTLQCDNNDTQFLHLSYDGVLYSDFAIYGRGLKGTFTVNDKALRTPDLLAAGMKEGYTSSDYYDDVCTCNFGVPDLACQNPEIGPANAEGCVGNEMCVVDNCIPGVKGGTSINCKYHDQHFGNDGVCECGCLGDSGLPDIDCFYPNRYYLRHPDGDEKNEMIGEFHGVSGSCSKFFPDCTNELWTCPIEMYNDSKSCECFCGYMDADCENKNLPTDCHDDFMCALTNSSNLTSQECLAPKGWTCDPNMYNLTGEYASKTTTCFCHCSLASPACLKKSVSQMVCPDGKTYNFKNDEIMCLPNGTCLDTPCGAGLNPRGNYRDCDGGEGCGRDCKCEYKLKPTIPHSKVCRLTCGDGFVEGDEECDGSQFCDNETCHCQPGHKWVAGDSKYGHCSGCGNQIRDEGEECDGGDGCLSTCMCDELSGYTISDKNDTTSCTKTSQTLPIIIGGSIGAVVLIVSIVILFIIVNHYKTDEQKATRKIRQSENAIKSAKSQNSKITFDSKSALNPQPKSAGPDPSIIAQLNVSTQGGGMALDDEDDGAIN